MKRRVLSFSLTIFIILTLLPVTTLAANLNGHWSEPAVKTCRDYGILDNEPDYNPDEVITRSEFCRMINRAFNFTETAGAKEFTDVDYGGEYGQDLKIAAAMGYISGYGERFGPDDSLTREMAFTILARIYALTGDDSAITKFADDGDISAWARGTMNAMIDAGYVAGNGNGTVSPQKALSKAEAAQILYNLFGAIAEKDTDGGNYKNLTVRKTGVTVKNTTVTGDMFVTDGVGAGDVMFENITVKDRTLITGGGSNSVSFKNSTLNNLVMSGRHNTHVKLTNTTLKNLTFLASNKVTLGSDVILFNAASGKLTLTGTFGKIMENADKTVTVTSNGVTFTMHFGADTPLKQLVKPVTTSTGGSSGGGGGGVTYYSIAFNANGGSGSMAAITNISSGSTKTLPVNSFTRANHTFAGWATSSAGAVAYADGASVTVNSNLTLYAVWTATPQSTYTISHNVPGNAHTFTGATVGYGAQTPLTVTITDTGNTALTGGSIALTTGTAFDLSKTTFNAIASGVTDTFTVTPKTGLAIGTYTDTVTVTGTPGGETAVFTVSFTVAPTYTVTYDAGSGTGTPPTDSTAYSGGASVTPASGAGLTPPANKIFYAWNTASNGSGTFHKAGVTFTITANTTLYAIYTGDGSDAANPVEIRDAVDLAAIGNDTNSLGKNYTLNGDIDLSDWNTGSGDWTPIGDDSDKFTGVFDGNGHTISNLTVNGDNYQGLFGGTADAEIRDLTLIGCDVSGDSYVGGLVGCAENTFISGCAVSGNVSSSSNSDNSVGGLVGEVIAAFGSSTIQNCYVSCDVEGELNDGGLIGHAVAYDSGNVTIQNCYAYGVINGSSSRVGGLVGCAQTVNTGNITIKNCCTYGTVEGSSSVGGLVGYMMHGVVIQYSAALNPSVEGNSNVGRVAGSGNGGTLTNNYANIGMTVNSFTVDSDSAAVGNDIHGANVDATQYSTEAWWSSFWTAVWGGSSADDTKPWVWDNSNQRPKFYWEP